MQSYLCEYEEAQDDMNPSLQGQDDNGLIEELKEDQWKLQQDAQQPEPCKLWHLQKVETQLY